MMLRLGLSGQRNRGRHKRRFMDAVREDMAVVEVTEEDVEDWTKMQMGNQQWRHLTAEAEITRRRKLPSSDYGGLHFHILYESIYCGDGLAPLAGVRC